MFEVNQFCSSPAEYIPTVKCAGRSLVLCGCFQRQGLKSSMHQNIEIALMKTQSRAFRTSDSGRFTFQQDNDPKHTTLWTSLSGPARDWAWTQSNICGQTWKCVSAPLQPDRAWEVKSEVKMAHNCQMLMSKACRIKKTKKSWDCKDASAKYLVKGMNTYAMYLFQFFYIKYIYEVVYIIYILINCCTKSTRYSKRYREMLISQHKLGSWSVHWVV